MTKRRRWLSLSVVAAAAATVVVGSGAATTVTIGRPGSALRSDPPLRKAQLHSPTHPKPAIDGALTPELISDATAYTMLLRMLSHDNTPDGLRKARAYARKVAGSHRKDTQESEELLALTARFKDRITAIDAERASRHLRGEMSSELVSARERVINDYQTALQNGMLGAKIDEYVRSHVKKRVRIFY